MTHQVPTSLSENFTTLSGLVKTVRTDVKHAMAHPDHFVTATLACSKAVTEIDKLQSEFQAALAALDTIRDEVDTQLDSLLNHQAQPKLGRTKT